MAGKLYVIGVPIGNLKDITLRAIETIGQVETLVCEDSRVASRLVNHLIKLEYLEEAPRYFSYNEFNENKVYEQIVEWVREGQVVGLVSDAGMPVLSDPGYRVIRECLDQELEIEIIPGPTALTTALAWSGIGGEVMQYVGFLPKKKAKAKKILESVREQFKRVESSKAVFYVSPYRLLKELEMIREIVGEVEAVLMRELTKKFQERIEGQISELIETAKKRKLKGEMVLIIKDSN